MIWSRSYPIIIDSAHNIPWENDASGARRRRCWKAQERLFEKTAGETVHGGKEEEEEGSSSAAFRQKKDPSRLLLSEDACMPPRSRLL